MTQSRWIILVIVLLVALFAVVVGGFLWPRPQFRKGPWTVPSPDSLEAPLDEPPAPVPGP